MLITILLIIIALALLPTALLVFDGLTAIPFILWEKWTYESPEEKRKRIEEMALYTIREQKYAEDWKNSHERKILFWLAGVLFITCGVILPIVLKLYEYFQR